MSVLPNGWTRRRLRFDLDTNPKKSLANLNPASEVSFVPMDAVGELGGLDTSITKDVADVYDGYTYFADGDVCVAKITPCFENGKGALAKGLTNGVGFGTTELHVLRPHASLDARFLFYLTIAHNFRHVGGAEMLGAGGQKRVPERFIKDWRPPLPPLETQRRIARFLDVKTARIDALIAKKRVLLERLTEKRQALITQAVTKGLDPNVPMKDSGIDWLGQIPAHWDVKRLRHLADVILGLTYAPEDVVDGTDGALVVRASNVQGGHLVHADDVYVSREVPAALICRPGDVVVCSRNGSRHLIGKCATVTSEWAGTTFGAFMTVIRSDHSAWLSWVLASQLFSFQSGRYMSSTINQLTTSTLKSFELPIPAKEEQARISATLTEVCQSIDNAITRVVHSLDVLVEYRAALVTSAVTGQLEIPADGQRVRPDARLGKLAAEVA